MKANIGRLTDRAGSICYRGTVEENGKTREFLVFKKRPRRIRIHIIENGSIVGVIGYDGKAVWRQSLAGPAIPGGRFRG